MPDPDLTHPVRRRRPRAAGVLTLALAWFFAARVVADRSANGLTLRFGESSLQPLVMAAFLLFLLLLGLALIASVAGARPPFRDLLGLPRRPTAGEEWRVGAALGWAAALLPLLLAVLTRSLHVQLWFAPRALWLASVGLAELALFSLAEEIVFRGYPFRQLIASTGPTRATVAMSLLYGVVYAFLFNGNLTTFFVTTLLGILLSAAWLRTHGLWLSWGLHFAWKATLAVLFGLPVAGASILSSITDGRTSGPPALTGGSFGPEGSLTALVALLLAFALLFPLTRNYAWSYTYAPITPGGYPVDVPPPAAHVAMDGKPAPPPPLIQILPSTPGSSPRPQLPTDPPA